MRPATAPKKRSCRCVHRAAVSNRGCQSSAAEGDRAPAVRVAKRMLTVRPTLQAGGLGRRLLASAEAWAAAQWGATRVTMTVIAQRPELIAWYERRGYVRTGEQQPFPHGDARFGLPQRDDLVFEVLVRQLA